MNLAEAAEDLVERSRLGDQNAQTMIYEVGRVVREEPNARAIASYRAIESYAKSTRDEIASFGGKVGHDARNVLAAFGAIESAQASGVDPFAAICALLAKLPTVGGDRACGAACVALSALPLPPSPQAIAEVSARAPTPADSAAIVHGATAPASVPSYRGHASERYAIAGWVLGGATRLRDFLRGAPSTVLGFDVAWELGGQ